VVVEGGVVVDVDVVATVVGVEVEDDALVVEVEREECDATGGSAALPLECKTAKATTTSSRAAPDPSQIPVRQRCALISGWSKTNSSWMSRSASSGVSPWSAHVPSSSMCPNCLSGRDLGRCQICLLRQPPTIRVEAIAPGAARTAAARSPRWPPRSVPAA